MRSSDEWVLCRQEEKEKDKDDVTHGIFLTPAQERYFLPATVMPIFVLPLIRAISNGAASRTREASESLTKGVFFK